MTRIERDPRFPVWEHGEAADDLEAYLVSIESGKRAVPDPIVSAVRHFRHYQKIHDWRPKAFNRAADTMGLLVLPAGPKNKDGTGSAKFKLAGWQLFLLAFISGLYDKKLGCRAIHQVNIGVPRKAGKSSFMAAWLLYTMLSERGWGRRYYLWSPTIEASEVTMDLIREMVASDKAGDNELDDYRLGFTTKKVECRINGGQIQMRSAGGRVKDGIIAQVAIVDEISALQDTSLMSTLKSGQNYDPDTLLITTSTPGDRPNNAYDQTREAMMSNWVNKKPGGKGVPTSVAGLYYEADIQEPWQDEELWHKVHPMLDEVRLMHYRTDARLAAGSPVEEAQFRTRNLATPMPTAAGWLTLESLRALPATRGKPPTGRDWDHVLALDASDGHDTNALCLLSMNRRTGMHEVRFKIMYPSGGARLAKDYMDTEDDIVEQGFTHHHQEYLRLARKHPDQVIICQGPVVPPERIVDEMLAIASQVKLRMIVHDQYSIHSVIKSLLPDEYRRKMHQVSFNPTNCTQAITFISSLVSRGMVRLEKNEAAIKQVAGCAVVYYMAGGMMIDKQRTPGKAKIDSGAAWILGVAGHLIVEGNAEKYRGLPVLPVDTEPAPPAADGTPKPPPNFVLD